MNMVIQRGRDIPATTSYICSPDLKPFLFFVFSFLFFIFYFLFF